MLGRVDAADAAGEQGRHRTLGELSDGRRCELGHEQATVSGAEAAEPDESDGAISREVGEDTDEETASSSGIARCSSSS